MLSDRNTIPQVATDFDSARVRRSPDAIVHTAQKKALLQVKAASSTTLPSCSESSIDFIFPKILRGFGGSAPDRSARGTRGEATLHKALDAAFHCQQTHSHQCYPPGDFRTGVLPQPPPLLPRPTKILCPDPPPRLDTFALLWPLWTRDPGGKRQ